ncbi:hypothetical protein MCOR14_004610 [Pyricularia oryzae]|uniref:RelA/SpoT domain-containing protein n=1 Tax=Pyricularia grisea TaxID=148305 RepID=A0ABQ8NHL8_PYRGI|nr:hypothetical protein MCOR01_005490 [Pyricularia oryzae]KAI6297232.1 hypothetical protein MCOR33_006369 [Pyricularia grisea]KAI6277749.1 hypothetical protein MCOR26_004951 [Pyricularia oryzae]KAI6339175.1 hypothetical protein MCOR30_002875 [Pyricularia oryzae]KAI6346317.1 hypothetical protein MCOR28_003048 [Pyricularia oryzae]
MASSNDRSEMSVAVRPGSPPLEPESGLKKINDELAGKWDKQVDAEQYFFEKMWPTVRPEYQKLEEHVATSIANGLATHPGKPSVALPIEHRIKSDDSIKSSIRRRKLKLQHGGPGSILEGIHDLVGFRIIVESSEDLGPVKKFIATNFDEAKPPTHFSRDLPRNPSDSKPQPEFGNYQSWNYRLFLKSSTGHKRFENVMFEVQLTTLAEALFNIYNHPLVYKQVSGPLSSEHGRLMDIFHGLVRQLVLVTSGLRGPLQGGSKTRTHTGNDPESGRLSGLEASSKLLQKIRQSAEQLRQRQESGRFKKEESLVNIVRTLSELVIDNRVDEAERRHDRFLGSLKFPGMNERRNNVVESHSDTFRWIFDKSKHEHSQTWSSFVDWLQSSKKLYWINGKPGSGKSTLMKFIAEQQETKKFLCQGRPEVPEWKSKEADTDWSESELRKLAKSAFSSDALPLCILIDGLDEVPVTQAEGLRDFVKELTQISNVKVCVSSRPEPAYKHAFQSHACLQLQDLTAIDIRNYAAAAIQDLMRLRNEDEIDASLTNRLEKTLIYRAGGVFLWLKLVAASLRRGLERGDSWDDLQKRLEELPTDISKLYSEMWMRLNEDTKTYRQAGAHYLNLIIHSMDLGSQCLMNLLVLEGAATPEFRDRLLSRAVHTPQSTQLDRIQQKIHARCAGLVDFFEKEPFNSLQRKLGPIATSVPRLIHRSAYDFLVHEDQGREIRRLDPSSPDDLCFELSQGALVYFRFLPLDPWSFTPPMLPMESVLYPLQHIGERSNLLSSLNSAWHHYELGHLPIPFSISERRKRHFLVFVADWFPEEVLLDMIKRCKNQMGLASRVLRESFLLDKLEPQFSFATLVRYLLPLAAGPSVMGVVFSSRHYQRYKPTPRLRMTNTNSGSQPDEVVPYQSVAGLYFLWLADIGIQGPPVHLEPSALFLDGDLNLEERIPIAATYQFLRDKVLFRCLSHEFELRKPHALADTIDTTWITINVNLAFLIQYLNDMEQHAIGSSGYDTEDSTLGPQYREPKTYIFAEKATLGRAEAKVEMLEYSRKSNAAQDNATTETKKICTMVDANMGQNITDQLRSLFRMDVYGRRPNTIPLMEAVLEAIDGFEQEGKYLESLSVEPLAHLAKLQCGFAFVSNIDMSDLDHRSPKQCEDQAAGRDGIVD